MRSTAIAVVLPFIMSCSPSTPKTVEIASYSGEPVIMKNTDPFTATTGKLKVVWTMKGDGKLTMNVEGRDGTAESVCVFADADGENRINVEPGEYYLKVVAGGLDWTATVYEDR